MTKVFLGIVLFIGKIIGSWEKSFKQKILLLILTYIVAYPVLMHLPDAVWAKNNRPMAALILAGFVLVANALLIGFLAWRGTRQFAHTAVDGD